MNRELRIRLSLVVIGILSFGTFIIYSLVFSDFDTSKNFVTPKILYASRGDIYSCNYQLMSTSPIMYNIAIDPTFAKQKNKHFKNDLIILAKELDELGFQDQKKFAQKIDKCIEKKIRYLSIKRQASIYEREKLKSLPILKNGRNYGYIEEIIRTNRFKPNNLLASKLLGKVNSNKKNKAYLQFGERQMPNGGLELSYDYLLRGRDGYLLQKKLKNNVSKPLPSFHSILPQDGKDIITTIDLNIQELAHVSLVSKLKEFEARFGTVIIMEVESGNIKAMVNLGRLNSKVYLEDWNYAVYGNPLITGFKKMEPGSTFKLASYLAYFEDGGNIEDTINTFNGNFKVPNTKKNIIDSEKNLGIITYNEAFSTSSNVGVARMILKNYKQNPTKFLNHINIFGLNEKSYIDLSNEPIPYIIHPDHSNWSEISLPWMSYGYGVNLTPLQTLTFYNAIANNGIRVTPKLVTHYIDGVDTIQLNRNLVTSKKICSDEALKKAHTILRNAVLNGTGKKLNDLNVLISGKTGTIVTNYDSKKDTTKTYQSSFVGFFPSNKPKYSCIVLIDNPNPEIGYYGSDVALPVFKNIVNGLKYNDTIIVSKSVISNFSFDTIVKSSYKFY